MTSSKKKTTAKKSTVNSRQKDKPQLVITNSTFNGMNWDKSALASLDQLVSGLNAGLRSNQVALEGLKNISELFKKVDVKYDSLLKIDGINGAFINDISLNPTTGGNALKVNQ